MVTGRPSGLSINTATKAFCAPDWSWRNDGHSRRDLNLWLVIAGRGTLQTGSRTYSLEPGSCLLYRHWLPHDCTTDPSEPLVVPYVCFECLDDSGTPFQPAESQLPCTYRRLGSTWLLETLLDRVADSFMRDAGSAAPGHWLRCALLELENADTQTNPPPDAEHMAVVERAARAMREDPSSNSVAQLARHAGFCVDYFIRIFRAQMGQTPGSYLIRCRIERACDLLLFSDHSVTRIADLLGYPDVCAFSRQFSAKIGCSPRAYRKRGVERSS